MEQTKAPWLSSYGKIPHTLNYFNGTMYEFLVRAAAPFPDLTAIAFENKKTTYRKFIENIEMCACGFYNEGIRKGDCVTIVAPNCPQALVVMYALNKLGAVACIVHPLSVENELTYFITKTNSKAVVVADLFYEKIRNIRKDVCAAKVVVISIGDELSFPMNLLYKLKTGKETKRFLQNEPIIGWKELLASGKNSKTVVEPSGNGNDTAVILFSGGTTGTPKGVCLTNRNMNALADQLRAANPFYDNESDSLLAAMPMFHGFGLAVCIHLALSAPVKCVLMPRFNAGSYCKTMLKHRCTFIAGVPTLFEKIQGEKIMKKADLSFLKAVFCGGDSITDAKREQLNAFLKEHHASVRIREGYGLTETVTACCCMPYDKEKEGSVGIPFPDNYIKIVKPGTDIELPYGEDGEIIISGPTVMKEYINEPEETASIMKTLSDGKKWIYSGDLGSLDADGFLYFKGRIKRVIITSGYNVYPEQLENIISQCDLVEACCVIGIPDPVKIQTVTAFVVLKNGAEHSEKTKKEIFDFCRKHIAVYALPREIEFCNGFPHTKIGKIDYKEMENNSINPSGH